MNKFTLIFLTIFYGLPIFSASIWIEGEEASVKQNKPHPWWYDKVKTDELSGNAWISHFSQDGPGTVGYDFKVAKAGNYNFWLRANPVQATLSYQLDKGEWISVNVNKDVQGQINIAADNKPDLRFIAWLKVGNLDLKLGKHTLKFKFSSKAQNHGAIDCFCLTTDAFVPSGTLKPGETAPVSTIISSGDTWAFNPPQDNFSSRAVLDLRNLNEKEAGETGWIKASKNGDFLKGDGKSIRFWSINTGVERDKPFKTRPLWKSNEPSIRKHARWLAKYGVNMVRCHSHINPDPKNQKLEDVNMSEIEWIWRTVGAMKKEGIYTTVSPYWSVSMKSDDKKWETDWNGNHHGLLFFDKKMQDAYKKWLKVLFTTPNKYLGGKTLANEPAFALFQIQNEDSLLFWTINGLKGEPKKRLGKLFGDWAKKKYGSLDKAFAAWNNQKLKGDDQASGILDFDNIWLMTADAKSKKLGQTLRIADQCQFWTESMYNFNQMIADYVHKDLKCPVLVNAGNWKTADNVLLNDAERYSYTANDVIAVNRYFGGIHKGKQCGWAIINGDVFKSDSALTDSALELPVTLKQVKGKPMLITESSWVFPNEFGAEGPFLISVYSSLTGFDSYYWFATGTETWTQPQSANGYMPSKQKWIFANPDIFALFPAASLAFRKNYIQQAEPSVVEHRSLNSIYQRKSPIIAESASFDPNRDAGDQPADSKFTTGVSPYAFLTGPVEVVYGSSEKNTKIANFAELIKDSGKGKIITSSTGQIVMNTDKGYCTVNAPKCQGVAAHFANQNTFKLRDVDIKCENDFASIMVVSLDDKPISTSGKILVQVGTQCRPTGWQEVSTQIKPKGGKPINGKKVINFGSAPWAVKKAKMVIQVKNKTVTKAVILNVDGTKKSEIPLKNGKFTFPEDSIYVVLQ